MNVIRWGVCFVAVTAAAVVAAPSALAAGADDAIGLSEHGSQLVAFNTADPGGARLLGDITGIGGDHLIGIDFRPKDHRLYGVGQNGRIYRIDAGTAHADEVGALSVGLDGGYWDIDFNAAGDSLRIVTDKGQNLHQPFGVDGPTGATVVDRDLSRRNIAALGYTGGNRALGIDTGRRQIVTIDGANGTVTGLGPADGLPRLSTASNGLDVAGDRAFAVVNIEHVHTLFAVDTADGSVHEVGAFNPEGNGASSFRHVIDLTIRR